MKRCFKCGAEKPVDDFYRHPQMGDGHLGKCKECTKRDVSHRARLLAGDAAWVERQRARGREKYARLYCVGPNWTSPEGPAQMKKNVNCKLRRAIINGTVVKPDVCSDCGKGGRIHGHHEDYSKPLEVIWVCPLCHRKRHALYPERVKAA